MNFRIVPPAGVPVRPGDIFKLIGARFTPSKSIGEFKRIIAEIAGVKHVFFINSGRAANYIILKILKSISGENKNEIIIPAYTCYSVPASIVRAGLKIHPIDIEPHTLDYNFNDLKTVDFSNILAILPCNLFGIVSDWKQIKSIIANRDIYAIDDSAQTMGLPSNGGNSGAMGDIGFYSFGRGKNMTTYSGGVILTNRDDLARLIEAEIAGYDEPGIVAEITTFIKFILYAMLLNPNRYWLPNSLPFLRLGFTEYDKDFEIGQLSGLQYCLGPIMFAKFRAVNDLRSRNAETIAGRVSSMEKFKITGPKQKNIPFLRLPILAPDRFTRDKIVQQLCQCGIISSGMYPSTVARIPQIGEHLAADNRDFKGGDTVVDCLFTLPTHPYVTDSDIDKMINCLESI